MNNKFKYLVVVLILLLSINNVNAISEKYLYYDTDGCGSWTLNNWDSMGNFYYDTNNNDLYFRNTVYIITGIGKHAVRLMTPPANSPFDEIHIYAPINPSTSNTFSYHYIPTLKRIYAVYSYSNVGGSITGNTYLTVSEYPIIDYIISGDLCGITYTKLYIKDGNDIYQLIETNTSSFYYSFNILSNTSYKLEFSDGYEYEFTCTGDITHDRDVCSYITLNFRDNCGNLLRETTGYWYTPDEYLPQSFYAVSGSCDIPYEEPDYLELWVGCAQGELYYNISNPQDITYSVNNPTISWNNNIYVIDGNTTHIIEDALVILNQDCIIDSSLYPSRVKYTDIDGYAKFYQCELDSFTIDVSATGYKSFSDSISSINLNAYKLGQTIIVKLYPIDDEINESEYTESDYGTWIKFKDIEGYYTTSILDNDTYVDLYYYNNNSEGTSMTLKFQKYNIYTGLVDILSWNIPHGENSYKRILKSNYTDYTYSYRGYLYNIEIDGWNRIKYLEVRNETKEEIDHYQNLSTILWFINKNSEGSIDYREDLSIVAYANSSNSSLLDISLELYDNGVYVMHTNLTWADFVSADMKWFYEWNPDHSYVNGHNYTVKMHGYDYYLLETDFINASDYRKNKLTIIVKDRTGNTLINSYIFLEGYGSLPTGINYYNSYEGLNNGNYRYKASKSGYTSGGWNNINITDSDNIVTYILSYDSGSTPLTQTKLSDNDLQKMFVCLMTILIIFILLGGLTHVAK